MLKFKRKSRVRKSKHVVKTRAYAFPLVVSSSDSAKLYHILTLCHGVRNELALARSDNRIAMRNLPESDRHYINCSDQYQALTTMVKANPKLKVIYSQVLQNVADRVDKGTQAWQAAINNEELQHIV